MLRHDETWEGGKGGKRKESEVFDLAINDSRLFINSSGRRQKNKHTHAQPHATRQDILKKCTLHVSWLMIEPLPLGGWARARARALSLSLPLSGRESPQG